ncbi:MAG: hypothetical protein OHK0017_00610 [Patescibacteria group bacterium]
MNLEKIKKRLIKFRPKLKGLIRPAIVFTVTAAILYLMYKIIIAKSRFVTGDQTMLGMMAQDMAEGKFYSWYFYGQTYYGNLLPFVLSIPAKFHEVNLNFLIFFELFFYGISVAIGLSAIRKIQYWIIPFGAFVLFAFGNHTQFTYSIHGFSFVLFIIAIFFWYFKAIVRDDLKLNLFTFFSVAAITGISLWHNPLYLFLIAALGVIVIYKQKFEKVFQFKLKHGLAAVGGGLIGLIPFILATISTNGQNLGYFFGNTSKTYWLNFRYLAYDFINIFSVFPTEDRSELTLVIKRIMNEEIRVLQPYLFNAFVILGVLTMVIFGLSLIKKDKGLAVNYMFLFFLLVLLVVKQIPPDSAVYSNLRYAFQFYFFVILTLIEIFAVSFQRMSLGKQFFEKTQMGLRIVAAPLLLVLLVNATSQTRIDWLERTNIIQFNQMLYNDLQAMGAKRVACYNYFEVCMPIAFWGRSSGMRVYGITEEDRNPSGKHIFDDPNDKSPVYSIVPRFMVKSNMEVIKSYRQLPVTPEYCLIRGNYLELSQVK